MPVLLISSQDKAPCKSVCVVTPGLLGVHLLEGWGDL